MDGTILQAVADASLIAKGVLGILVLMSLISWTIIFWKYRVVTKAQHGLAHFIGLVLTPGSLPELEKQVCTNKQHALTRISRLGFTELHALQTKPHIDSLAEHMRRLLDHGISEEIRDLNTSLDFLATAGNAAPFIGLFGTVWGIIHSFHTIGQMHSASLATVAPGISEALIATAVGLAVAIPANIAYNMFSGKIDSIESQYMSFADLLLNKFCQGAPQASSQPKVTPLYSQQVR